MNLSMKWLSDYIQEEIPVKEFCHRMTMSGSKVEGFETEGSSISKVVVGKILSIAPHENADALFVCQVEIGAEAPVQIVTNAKNVKPYFHVIFSYFLIQPVSVPISSQAQPPMAL